MGDDCEFHWEVAPSGEKVWAVIPGSCKKNPVDECHNVHKTWGKQVAYQVCEDVPEQKCQYVNRQECYKVPDKVCKSEPITQCSEVPKQICKVHPKKVCHVPGHVVHHVNEFVPAPQPVPVLPVAVPAVPVTTPSALDDILNRNENNNNVEFEGENNVDQVAAAADNIDQLDRFVFEEESDSANNSNSTINFQ